MDSFLAIVNPAAGHGRAGKLAKTEIERLQSRGLAVVVRETGAPGDATRMADNALREGFRRFIAVGGDGTGFEVVNGLSSHLGTKDPAQRVSLGFLPLGTGNSFLRDFGAGTVEHATEALLQRRKRSVDAVKLTHSSGVLHFINLLSFGFVADVCAVTNRRFKLLGQAGYGLGVVATLAGLHTRPLRMRVDGGAPWEQDVVFVSINNSKFTGGNMMMAPYADASDGMLDIVVCGKMSRATLLETFPKIFSGHHVHHHAVTASRARLIELFEGEAIDLMIDGEVIREKPQRVECLHDALDVWV
jgi:diacylglycerol kinase (ATP)